jgi:glycosylphosphatidylinositol transamidase (GPIT) subunit GPI8
MYIIIAILILPIFAANWAVLVAGSNGFYNYRH